MRTFLATIFIVITGLLILWVSTDGGRAFTVEEARRLEVRENPRSVPNWRLQNQDSELVSLHDWHGQFIVIDFIYTSCPSVCLILSSGLRSLQNDFAAQLEKNNLRFLSISFDPENDTPQRLKEHLSHFSANLKYWMAARPTSLSQKEIILDFFKVIVIPDEYGGYTHSAGYHVIDPESRLVAIFGVEQLNELKEYLTQVINKENVHQD
ncbi:MULTISPECIES: SCO family protein [unclassified Nitrosomonas]|uniref:SCO family protein n=1 Tax=unclassified Nitrosomonas TaxID=2609265 RepID=UPI000897C3ED|nr:MULTISPECIES: SCO family protein [unclassified Nitrosomonas]MDV6343483.1 SCO family protein [Nitrosomonas sp. Is37]SDY87958.1 protein SCO1/2 [Nitrosomonas sp. Nm33]